MMTELCAVLAFSAIQNNDKIGVIFFSDQIEKFIPPKKGKMHILRIIRELIEFEPVNKGTDIGQALRYMTNMIKKRSIAFVISDFMSDGFEDALKIANRKHDMIALRVYDKRESELPDIGLVQMMDAETGKRIWLDTSDTSLRRSYAEKWKEREANLSVSFAKCGVDQARISTEQSYVQPLMALFKKRGARS
jgi:uncharacterized protein (DUF58 family)